MTRVDHLPPEEQFALLLDGELRPDDVGHDVRSLLSLTEALDEHVTVPRPELEFRADLRGRLIIAADADADSLWDRARNAFWMRTANIRNSIRAAVASGVAASMIGTAGVAAASQHALPGELLYPVKELTETVRIGLAGDLEATGRLHLRFAEERLEEVEDGAQNLRAEHLIDTLDEMDEESIAGAEDLLGWATRTGDERALDELRTFTDHQRDGLRGVIDRLPSAVVPFAEDSLEVLRRIDIEVDGGLEPCDCPDVSQIDATLQPGGDQQPTVAAPGEAPAGAPERPCACVPATDEPPAAREPEDREDEQDPPADGPPPPTEDEPVDLVPELPGPLNDVGNAVDDALNGVLEESEPVTDPLPADPEDEVVEPVEETADDLLDDAPTPEPTPSPSL